MVSVFLQLWQLRSRLSWQSGLVPMLLLLFSQMLNMKPIGNVSDIAFVLVTVEDINMVVLQGSSVCDHTP